MVAVFYKHFTPDGVLGTARMRRWTARDWQRCWRAKVITLNIQSEEG